MASRRRPSIDVAITVNLGLSFVADADHYLTVVRQPIALHKSMPLVYSRMSLVMPIASPTVKPPSDGTKAADRSNRQSIDTVTSQNFGES